MTDDGTSVPPSWTEDDWQHVLDNVERYMPSEEESDEDRLWAAFDRGDEAQGWR